MVEGNSRIESDRRSIILAQQRGLSATLRSYVKLSGPGWLQSALTLGGGSLGSSLYLGILAGTSLLWLQPLAMLLGVIMLSAISYVTLSINERPFRVINKHVNPVLGWSWLGAALIANMVWALPQYSLCFAVCEQNFFPGVFQNEGLLAPGPDGSDLGKWIVSISILILCTIVTWSYGSGKMGVKFYELLLKIVVAAIVLCFIGVVIRMSLVEHGIDWGAVMGGLIPHVSQFYKPSDTFRPLLDNLKDSAVRGYWSDLIVSEQRDVMLSAAAAAVGVNMTFLLPYSLLSRGWDKTFRGLTNFDLCFGTFIPYVLATGCIVIAGAQQFHGKVPDGCIVSTTRVEVPNRLQLSYDSMIARRNQVLVTTANDNPGPPSINEQQLATMLVRRDTLDLARSLQRLFADDQGQGGHLFANIVFGVGVVGMTLSSISLMMLVSGFVVCEVFNRPASGWLFRIGCLAAATGALWPLVWDGSAKAWLTVAAGVFCVMLLPIAYVTFFIMINQKSLLGADFPAGWKRWVSNLLMAIAVLAATTAAISAVLKKAGLAGLAIVATVLALAIVVPLIRRRSRLPTKVTAAS